MWGSFQGGDLKFDFWQYEVVLTEIFLDWHDNQMMTKRYNQNTNPPVLIVCTYHLYGLPSSPTKLVRFKKNSWAFMLKSKKRRVHPKTKSADPLDLPMVGDLLATHEREDVWWNEWRKEKSVNSI